MNRHTYSLLYNMPWRHRQRAEEQLYPFSNLGATWGWVVNTTSWLFYDHCKNGYSHKRNISGKTEKSGEFMGRQIEEIRWNVQEEFLWQGREQWKRYCYMTPWWTHQWLMMMPHLEVECHILDPAQRAVWWRENESIKIISWLWASFWVYQLLFHSSKTFLLLTCLLPAFCLGQFFSFAFLL